MKIYSLFLLAVLAIALLGAETAYSHGRHGDSCTTESDCRSDCNGQLTSERHYLCVNNICEHSREVACSATEMCILGSCEDRPPESDEVIFNINGGNIGAGCFTAGSLGSTAWARVQVQDSGDTRRHIVWNVFRSDKAGCAATLDSPSPGKSTTGKCSFEAHENGYCTLNYDVSANNCGRVQFDAAFSDGGPNFLAGVINYGVDCPSGSVCGNGRIEGSEQCDDGNKINGDGCSAACTIEKQEKPPIGYHDVANCEYTTGWACDSDNFDAPLQVHFYVDGPAGTGTFAGATTANLQRGVGVANVCGGNPNHGFFASINSLSADLKDGKQHTIYAYAINHPSGSNPLLSNSPRSVLCKPAPVCGNNITEAGEECDDGNSNNADACSNSCKLTFCGDKIIQNPNGNGINEQCDDGNKISGDGCSAACTIEECVSDSDCSDGLFCNGNEVCDPDTYTCRQGKPVACDNGLFCDGQEVCDEFTDSCRTKNVPKCDDDLFCNGQETCDESKNKCVSGSPIDCSINDIPEVNTCTNVPDGNPYTLDFRQEFKSVCDENTNSCTTGDEKITHICDVLCGADARCGGKNPGDDRCNDSCQWAAHCGDGIIDEGEQCDDGNNINGDGCSAVCELEICTDDVPPDTEKTYGQPFSMDTSEWISSSTPITLEADDELACEEGIIITYYRTTLVNDENCMNYAACINLNGDGPWLKYHDPFTISEESCHLIEFFSYDTANNTEKVNKQCAFVDNTPPALNKTVGTPREAWGGDDTYYNITERCWAGENGIECWSVTLSTPINLSCLDREPHPVGHERVCFKAGLDGDDATQRYCSHYGGSVENDFCCVDNNLEFYFLEESQHNLDFYCEDALGNRGEIDEEKFKVEGEVFTIKLNKKWNLISVPFVLLDNSPENVFGDVSNEVESVWTYDENEWLVFTPDGIDNDNLNSINPGWGYWVLARNDTALAIGGSLFSPATIPPSKHITNGWNLIGYYGDRDENGNRIPAYDGPGGEGKPAKCALGSLVSPTGFPEWSSLVTYWEPLNPSHWIELDFLDRMDPGAGYLVFTDTSGTYAPSTVCER